MWEIFFLKTQAENEVGRLGPDLFWVLKSFTQGKSKWSAP